MAFGTTGVSPATVSDKGGEILTLTGEYTQGEALYVFISPASDNIQCYSGVVGQEFEVFSEDGLTLTCIMPKMPVGGPYSIRVAEADGGNSHIRLASITVVHQTYETQLYTMRENLGSPRDAGPRTYASEEYGSSTEPYDLLRAVVSSIADTMLELFGFVLTRSTAAYTAGGGTLTVESTYGFPTSGELAAPAGTLTYSGRTATTFTGVTADFDIANGSMIVDSSRTQSAIDLLRRSFYISTAAEGEIEIIGANFGFTRPRGVSIETYRELLKIVAWGPSQTKYAVELMLTAIYGEGNFEIWEDPELERNTLFVKLPGIMPIDPPRGATYLIGLEPVTDSGTTVTVAYQPVIVYGIWDELDEYRRGTNYLMFAISGSDFLGDGTGELNHLEADTPGSYFVAQDVGRLFEVYDTVNDVTMTWVSNGVPNADHVVLVGRTRHDGRVLDSDPDIFQMDVPTFNRAMVDNCSIEIVAGDNMGRWAIEEYISPYKVRLTGVAFATELTVKWRLIPLFRASPDYQLKVARYTIAAKTITIGNTLAAADYLVDYSTTRDDGQIRPDLEPKSGEMAPFYLYDVGDLGRTLLNLILASGVLPEIIYDE